MLEAGEQYSRMVLTRLLYEVSFTLTDPVLRLQQRKLRAEVDLSACVSLCVISRLVVGL